jgi:glycosyltransferase involved in cell wall biosynthesis
MVMTDPAHRDLLVPMSLTVLLARGREAATKGHDMLPSSAFITVGESHKNLANVAAGRAPGAEYAVLRNGHFSRVFAMVDEPRSSGSGLPYWSFGVRAYRASWGLENIYLGEEFPGIQYLAVHAALRRKKRIAMLIHNVASLRRRLPLATLGLARLLEHVLCLSEESRRELEASYRVPPKRITVIGSRVDTQFFKPEPEAQIARQVCSAGAVNRDYRTLVEAVRPLGIATKIAADTAWQHSGGATHLESLPDFVEMRSWGNYQNLRRLYAESAVVVVPLERAMLSGVTVALEAMAMAKPVILTRNAYVDEFLRDGENGYFVGHGDVLGLRTKIQYLLDHPDEAARMGARARDWVLSRYTVESYVQKILSVW